MADRAESPRVYASIDETDREEWSGVVSSAGAPAFYDYAFLQAYERAPLVDTHAFFYLVFGRPAAAVLPAYVQGTDEALGNISGDALPGRSPGDRILLTHVAHCYDTMLPARPRQLTPHLAGQAAAALAGLARQAGAKWFAFQNVDRASETARSLALAGLVQAPMSTRFRRDLSAYRTAEDFVAGLPGQKARRALRTSRHQARRQGMTVASVDPVHGAREAVELCRRTTARHGTARYYPECFHEFVALAGNLLVVTEVRLGGLLASAAICPFDRQRFHLWAGGLDYDVTAAIHSAFPLMLWAAVEETVSRGRQILEAGRGNAAAKAQFRLDPVPLVAFVGQP